MHRPSRERHQQSNAGRISRNGARVVRRENGTSSPRRCANQQKRCSHRPSRKRQGAKETGRNGARAAERSGRRAQVRGRLARPDRLPRVAALHLGARDREVAADARAVRGLGRERPGRPRGRRAARRALRHRHVLAVYRKQRRRRRRGGPEVRLRRRRRVSRRAEFPRRWWSRWGRGDAAGRHVEYFLGDRTAERGGLVGGRVAPRNEVVSWGDGSRRRTRSGDGVAATPRGDAWLFRGPNASSNIRGRLAGRTTSGRATRSGRSCSYPS